MVRKRNPLRREPQTMKAQRVRCVDGYYRLSYQALVVLACAWCQHTINPGEVLTMRREGNATLTSEGARKRYPVCQRCNPFQVA